MLKASAQVRNKKRTHLLKAPAYIHSKGAHLLTEPRTALQPTEVGRAFSNIFQFSFLLVRMKYLDITKYLRRIDIEFEEFHSKKVNF